MNAIELVTTAFGWALVHSVWQIALVGAVVRISLALFSKIPAFRKHFILLLGLSIVFLSFIGTIGIYIKNGGNSGSETFTSVQPKGVFGDASVSEYKTSGRVDQKTTEFEKIQSYITAHTRTISGIWVLGFLIFLVRFTGSSLYIYRLRNKYAVELDEKWQAIGTRIRKNLIIKRTIRFLESDLIQVPLTTGILQPVIILPLGLVTHIPFNQLEAVLVHEMAHIKRHDYLINIFRSLLEALFFYHPVFWWLSGKLEIYREHACDDITINQCGSPEPLQLALLDLSSFKPKAMDPAAALFNNSNQLLKRIKRMKTRDNKPKKKGNLAGIILFPTVILTLALASAFAPRMADYPEVTKAMNPPFEIRSEIPTIPSNMIDPETALQTPEARETIIDIPTGIPDSTKKTIGVKTKTEEGYILLEFDENMNVQKITKNGKELQGKEKEKYQRLADRTRKVFEEEEKMKARQQELEALEQKLEEVQKRMQEVQEEYSELWQSYREKSMLNGNFPMPEVYADVFSDFAVPPPTFDVYPHHRDVPYPFDSVFHIYKDFDFENEFDPNEFNDQMKRSMDLYEDALRKQELTHEKRMQEYKLQQEKHYDQAKKYRLQQELFHVFEDKVRRELLQDELIDAWDDFESFELTKDYLKVDGKKQSKKLHQKYLELYESVMDKELGEHFEIR